MIGARFIAPLMAILIASAPARSQDQTPQAELDKVWNLAGHPEEVAAEPINMKLRVLDEYMPSDAELSRLMAEIKGHPQHPDRMRVEEYLTRRAGIPTGTRYEFWKQGPAWRLNTDYFPGGQKIDCAVNGDELWQWSVGGQLTIFPPGPGITPGYDFTQFTTSYWTTLAIFDTSGLSILGRLTRAAPAPRVSVSGDGQWHAAAEIEGESLRLEGTTSEGFQITRIVHDMPVGTDRLVTQLDSRYEDGRAVEVVQLANGRPRQRYVLEARGPISPAELREAVRVPRDGVPDLARGSAAIGQIDDARGSRHTRTELQSGERVVISSEPSRTATRMALRWWGLLTGVVVVSGVALVRWHRRKSGLKGTT